MLALPLVQVLGPGSPHCLTSSRNWAKPSLGWRMGWTELPLDSPVWATKPSERLTGLQALSLALLVLALVLQQPGLVHWERTSLHSPENRVTVPAGHSPAPAKAADHAQVIALLRAARRPFRALFRSLFG